nr:MAG TPA: RNA polymerase Rpb2-like protein [Caudoviricetes sp.]
MYRWLVGNLRLWSIISNQSSSIEQNEIRRNSKKSQYGYICPYFE